MGPYFYWNQIRWKRTKMVWFGAQSIIVLLLAYGRMHTVKRNENSLVWGAMHFRSSSSILKDAYGEKEQKWFTLARSDRGRLTRNMYSSMLYRLRHFNYLKIYKCMAGYLQWRMLPRPRKRLCHLAFYNSLLSWCIDVLLYSLFDWVYYSLLNWTNCGFFTFPCARPVFKMDANAVPEWTKKCCL